MSNTIAVPAAERLRSFLEAATEQAPVDPEKAALDIVARILTAGSVEEVFSDVSAVHAADVIGQPLIITGYTFNESDLKESGPAFYMLLDCVDDDGVAFKVTCGALNVMAQVYQLGELGALPYVAKITEREKKTKAGYRPMWLEAVSPADGPTATGGATPEPF